MKNKDILLLLLPSVMLAVMALYILRFSHVISDNSLMVNDDFEKMSQENFDAFAAKVQSGSLKLAPDEIISLLQHDRKLRGLQQSMISSSSRGMRAFGSGTLFAVVVHIYLFVRLITGCEKSNQPSC
jgi:predicted PurR-regulated permease PerM